MSRRRLWLLAAGLLTVALLLVGCGNGDQSAGQGDQSATEAKEAGSQSGSDGVRQIVITASNFKFDQEAYTVNKGETVEIILENAEGYHQAIIDGYDVELKPNEPVTIVADQAGEFDLFCSVVCGPIDDHNNMRSKFVVVE